MKFLGDPDDVCPISFLPVREIAHPVGFDAHRAFDCDSVTEWITKHRATHPVTTLPVDGRRVVDVLFPLVIEGDGAHVGETRIKLSEAGLIILGKRARLRLAFWPLVVHLLLFSLAAYALGRSYLTLLAVGGSWAHLAYQTRKTYPRDGGQLLLSFVSIWLNMHLIGGMCSVDFSLSAAVAHGLVLCLRLVIDFMQKRIPSLVNP